MGPWAGWGGPWGGEDPLVLASASRQVLPGLKPPPAWIPQLLSAKSSLSPHSGPPLPPQTPTSDCSRLQRLFLGIKSYRTRP